MDNIIDIPKYDPKKSHSENSPSWIEEDGKKPIIICKCGRGTVIDNHTLHKDGRVTASYYHSESMPLGCGWHVFLRLKNWNGGYIK
ncbi:MAG: hypothetical protein RLO03_13890 [Balneola sp.]